MASQIKGMAELRKAFSDLAKMAEKNQSTALKLAANEYKNDVQEGAPYKTGTLRRSIHVEMVSSSQALVGTDLPYAKIQEYGGIIKAKNGPYLIFKIGNQWVQTPQVQIPAHPYFRPPLDLNWQKYQKTYLEALGRA